MFFLLSKTLDVALTPLAWAILFLLVGLLGRAPSTRRRGVAVAGLLILLVFSLDAVSNGLYRSLESPPLRTFRPGVTYDVAILLGGLENDRVAASWGERAFNDNNERLLETYDLLRTGAARYAIISGGSPPEAHASLVEARVLSDQLIEWGIAPDRLVVEGHARNTHENAVESAAIVRARGWQSVLLVTSAFHMPRAFGCFRAEGLTPDTKPVDFRSFGPGISPDWIPRADHLADSSAAIREWVGRVVYSLRGYSR